jgi:UDP-GlcNAc:undecaprenyl-phosphate GlcNAc-1-phosphate transferase
MFFGIIFVSVFFLAVIFTLVIKRLARRLGVVDQPNEQRKIHLFATPLLGGLAIFIAFFVALYFLHPRLLTGNLEPRHWLGFFIGACVLMIGGFLDDKYRLTPLKQIIFPLLAIIAVVFGGVQIEKITNPFGGFIYLGLWSAPLIAVWLLGMMYTTKLLDGLDGLVTGVSAIGAFIIFLFTMTTKYYQPDIGLAALILSAACLGFLLFNWHPASIFLGEGGSLFLGFALGVLAIISGGKIAIALLVMGVPILDVFWTIIRRAAAGVNPFKFADRKHLHFRLLDLGLSQRKVALIYYFFAAFFGLFALFLQSLGKIYALSILLVLMILMIIGFSYFDRRGKRARP